MKNQFQELLNLIDDCLEKKHQPDPELVKKHNADSLNKDWQIPEGALWEQSDVVHDILAFLAEQMIEMNKEKQAIIRSFLGWLEAEIIKGSAEDLKNKTKVKEFYNYTVEDLLKVLKQNKLVPDPTPSKIRQPIEEAFTEAIKQLQPLMQRIKATDDLIDKIVYKLYGLTEEEIKIVEEKNR